MSGESPREEKIDDVATCNAAGAANKVRTIGDTAAPTVERQRSRQQLMACWPLGQHASCDASECAIAVVWQSADINGEVEANAALDPCRPMAIIKIRAISSRFMRPSIAVTMTERKLSRRTATLHSKAARKPRAIARGAITQPESAQPPDHIGSVDDEPAASRWRERIGIRR
jgi:hypothetical protein